MQVPLHIGEGTLHVVTSCNMLAVFLVWVAIVTLVCPFFFRTHFAYSLKPKNMAFFSCYCNWGCACGCA